MVRLILLAQKPIGERAFERVAAEAAIDIVAVVTNVEPAGWWGTARIAEAATRRGYRVIDNRTRDEAAIVTAARGADLLLSVQHPWVISSDVLEAIPGLNLHLAPLPEYRGYDGPTHAILDDAAEYGATLHWLAEGIDGGEIAFDRRFRIRADDTARSLYDRAENAGAGLVGRLVTALAGGRPVPRRTQGPGGRTFTRSALDALREVKPGDDVERKARAFHFPPYPPAYRIEDGVRVPVVPGNGGR